MPKTFLTLQKTTNLPIRFRIKQNKKIKNIFKKNKLLRYSFMLMYWETKKFFFSKKKFTNRKKNVGISQEKKNENIFFYFKTNLNENTKINSHGPVLT